MKLKISNIQTKDVLSILILLIQGFDIFIHAINGQLESIRVQSNIVIVLWVFYLYIKPNSLSLKIITTITISIYVILNFLFLFENGWINPSDNSFRLMLILLVVLTSLLSILRYSIVYNVERIKQ